VKRPSHLRLVWSAGATSTSSPSSGRREIVTPTRSGPCRITDHERPAGRFRCDECANQVFIDCGAHVACTSPTRYFRPRA
jgi:hypothetical protein